MVATDVDSELIRAVEALRGASRVLVAAHEGPDGDAIGSSIACARIAEALGASVTLFNVDPVPATFAFLVGSDRFVQQLPADAHFDVSVLLDCSERGRAGKGFPSAGWGDVTICIDHHVTHDPNVADIFVHEPEAAATGELVYRLALAAGVDVDAPMAASLYCAIMTDTGSFRYGSTRAETMEIGAALLRTGINAWDIASAVYESESLARIRLLTAVLQTLEVSESGRLATIVITDEMFAATGADPSMTDGLVNYARSVRGVDVAAQLVEVGPDRFRVGLRSRGRISVAAVAEHFGGGGHRNAAGFTGHGPLADVRRALDEALSAVIDAAQ